MTVDVINTQREKVGAIELSDELFGGRPNTYLVWEAVVQENASARRGTHASKTRGLVSGSGKKPWRQKGTGRAQVGDKRSPLWRHGGTIFGPQPRDYSYSLPHKAQLGALRAALAEKLQEGSLLIVDDLSTIEAKSKTARELLDRIGAKGRALVLDVTPSDALTRSTKNLKGVALRSATRVTARDVAVAMKVVATRSAVERLQQVLA